MASSCTADVEDIEDIVSPGDTSFQASSRSGSRVLPRALRKKKLGALDDSLAVCDSFIPGRHLIYIKTWGCTHNTSDGEYMAGLLAASGYSIVDSPLEASMWLLNSCTVKGPSEDGFRNSVAKGRELGKALVLAGCVPQGEKTHPSIQGISVVGVQHIDRVVEVVEETLKGNVVHLFSQRRDGNKRLAGPRLDLPKIRKNPLVEIIPINSGCLNHCTYCKTKHARGSLVSYSPDEIVNRAKQAFNEGVVELWITSEDTGAYGRDIGSSLPELLQQLVCVIPDHCMLRIGMTNPPYILEHLQEMSEILSHPRVYSFLHVPVQSGSDPVLRDMKREYRVTDFTHVVDFLRERVPGITIATDIICGFPTETDEDFEATLDLVKEYKFPSLFINQFYPRPGTPAAKMKRIPTQDVKQRSRLLSQLFQSYRPYDNQKGRKERVLVTEKAHDGIHFVAHNKSYDQVLIPCQEGLLGKMVEVEIVSTGKHYLIGHLVETPRKDKPLKQRMSSSSSSSSLFSSYWSGCTSTDVVLLVILGLLVLLAILLHSTSLPLLKLLLSFVS